MQMNVKRAKTEYKKLKTYNLEENFECSVRLKSHLKLLWEVGAYYFTATYHQRGLEILWPPFVEVSRAKLPVFCLGPFPNLPDNWRVCVDCMKPATHVTHTRAKLNN